MTYLRLCCNNLFIRGNRLHAPARLVVESFLHGRVSKGEPRRFVFQGVHMLFDSQPDRPWGDMPRRNQLVFIGRNLDEAHMQQGFDECLI